MDKFEELYRKDQYHISRWEKHYSNKEFYGIHQKIKDELEKLLNKKKKLTPKQKFICAMIYHHEFDISSSKKALKFVREAQAEGYFKQKWLIGSILDRLLQLQGKPQKYGTQIVELKNGKYKQYRLDSSVSDEERIKIGLPRLKDLKRYLEDETINRFWGKWENTDEIEMGAIDSVERAIKILFKNIPKEKIISIYIKGSFVRREMHRKSDVDIVPIVKDNQTLRDIIKLDEKKGELYKPSELLPTSLSELENNKRIMKSSFPKGNPDLFLFHLNSHKLIYGKNLNKEDYKIRTLEEMFKTRIKEVENMFLPLYRNNEIGFGQILKQVLFLTDLELRMKGENPNLSWRGITKKVKNKNHIIHETYKLRKKPTKDEKIRSDYVGKLESHIRKLKKKWDDKLILLRWLSIF